MNPDRLERLAPLLYAEAVPSPGLRERLLACVSPTPRRSLGWGLVGGGLVTLVLAGVFVLMRPHPAYADLQSAMAQVETASWTTETQEGEGPTKTIRITHAYASRTQPALASYTEGGGATLQTPRLSLTYEPRGDLYLKDRPASATTLRRTIQERFFPQPQPRTTASTPYHWTPWRMEPTVWAGQRVFRFHHECHYLREVYTETLWADRTTRRLVRRENTIAWPGTWVHEIARDFHYDQVLPASAFTLTVPPGKRVFRTDQHFSGGTQALVPAPAERAAITRLLKQLDRGWARREPRVFAAAFDFAYLPRLYNGTLRPDPAVRARQQAAYWRRRIAQDQTLRPRWDRWDSTLVSVEAQPGVRILGLLPFCLPEGDPPVWKAKIAVQCEAHQGVSPVSHGTTGYTLWLRRVPGGFRVIYAELDAAFGERGRPMPRLFDPEDGW